MNSKNRKIWGFIFVLPQLIGLILFSLIPLFNTISISFTEWDGISPVKKFVGLNNYIAEFNNPDFIKGLRNTLYYMILHVPFVIILGLLVALAVKNIYGKTVYRVIYFMPVVTGSVSVGVIWTWLLNGEFGLINQFLSMIGIKGPQWLTDPRWVLPAIAIVAVWWGLGYNMVIFLASLQNVPKTYYEAAEIDGANGYYKFLHITLPMISPTTFFVTVMTIINSFQVFDLAMVMTEGGPAKASYTFVYHIYESAFIKFRMGNATASAMVLFVIILIVTLFQMRMSERWVNYDI
ncbi:MAG TPA: sugar ABC transporter permease [Tissierellaceae bacterium]